MAVDFWRLSIYFSKKKKKHLSKQGVMGFEPQTNNHGPWYQTTRPAKELLDMEF